MSSSIFNARIQNRNANKRALAFVVLGVKKDGGTYSIKTARPEDFHAASEKAEEQAAYFASLNPGKSFRVVANPNA